MPFAAFKIRVEKYFQKPYCFFVINKIRAEANNICIIMLSCHVTCFMFFFNKFRAHKYCNTVALTVAGMLLPVFFFCIGLTETVMTASNVIVMYLYLAVILMASVLNKART